MDRIHLGFAAAVAAVLIGGAGEPPLPASSATPETDGLFSTSFRTPRFYSVETQTLLLGKTRTRLEKMCLGGAPLRALVESIELIGQDSKTSAQLAKGCSSRFTRKGREISRISTCDEAKGAAVTSLSKATGTPDDLRTHYEMALDGAGRSVKDRHMIYLGDCPANVKPGQVIEADGTVIDLLGSDPGD